MSKAEFIAELNDRLAVLTDEERRDILDEYEQHIDIKVMRGMSEDAAIADFGRIEELAADILEAYHVRADYAAVEKERKGKGFGELFKKKPVPASIHADQEESAKNRTEDKEAALESGEGEWLDRIYENTWNGVKGAGGGIWRLCRKAGGGVWDFLKKAGNLTKEAAAEIADFCRKPFRKRSAGENAVQEAEEIEETAMEEVPEMADRETSAGKRERKKRMRTEAGFSIGKAVAGFFRACAEAVLWCLRWCWNLLCIGAGMVLGLGSCLVVFAMGVLVVLLVLGYPLAGVTIGCLGITMCMVSVTVWCFSMVIRNRKKRPGKAAGTDAEMLTADSIATEKTDMPEETAAEEEEMIHA